MITQEPFVQCYPILLQWSSIWWPKYITILDDLDQVGQGHLRRYFGANSRTAWLTLFEHGKLPRILIKAKKGID
jgi:hypothetical protein